MTRPARRSNRPVPSTTLPRPNHPRDSGPTGWPPVSASDGPSFRDVLQMVAAAASTGAGAIHFAVMGHEWDEHLVSGLILAGFAWLQIMWAAGLRSSPSRVMLIAGTTLHVVAITAWVLQKVTGVGPDYTSSDLAGLGAVCLELVAVSAALLMLRPVPRIDAVRFSAAAAGHHHDGDLGGSNRLHDRDHRSLRRRIDATAMAIGDPVGPWRTISSR